MGNNIWRQEPTRQEGPELTREGVAVRREWGAEDRHGKEAEQAWTRSYKHDISFEELMQALGGSGQGG